MARNPNGTDADLIPMMSAAPPMSPVDPHATLTVPIGPPQPDNPATMGMPQSAPRMSNLDPIQKHMQDRLMADYKKDANPYGSADNHPGFFGKLLHGLSVATGGPGLRRFEEEGGLNRRGQKVEGLEGRLEDLSKEESAENLQGAEAGNQTAQGGKNTEETREMPGKAAVAHDLSVAETGNYRSETEARNNPQPNLATAYAHAVNDALTNGRDPAQDPVVQHLSHAITSIQRQPAPKAPPGMHAVTLDIPGKGRVAGKTDTQGNLLMEDGTPAPHGSTLYQQPNYGMEILPTKTTTIIPQSGPYAGIPVEVPWNPQTHNWDMEHPIGMSASNAYGHEAAQAGAVNRGAAGLIQEIQAHKDKLGNPKAIIQSAILGTPWADPETAGLRAQIATFAALQPSMHGFRGTDAMRQFEKILGGIPNNPDAMIAAIQGITKTAGAINPGLNSSGQHSGANEKSVSLKAAMALPINKGKSEAEVRKDIEAHGHTVAQ